MTAFLHFLAKELTEIRRTWRLPTIAGVLLFFGVMSPLVALATPALVEAVTTGQPGLVIKVPDPTYLDSYLQWMKNLSQMGLLIVVFGSGGLIANERTSGTAALVVTKPVSRDMFVIAKYVAQVTLVTAATIVGALITYVGTLLAFGEAPPQALVSSTAAWLAGALLAIAVVEALSAIVPTLAAGIGGLVIWGVAGIAALWEPAVSYTPVGLLTAPGALLAGRATPLLWPLVSTAVCIVVLVALAGRLFSLREL